jgi:hypothetical protein
MTATVTRSEPVPLTRPVAERRIWTNPRAGFDVIGQQAAPQVQVSADLYFALSDLDALAGWNALVPGIGTLLIIALVGIGVWPRIAEYR